MAAAEGAGRRNRLAGHAHEAPHPVFMPPPPDFELFNDLVYSLSLFSVVLTFRFIICVEWRRLYFGGKFD